MRGEKVYALRGALFGEQIRTRSGKGHPMLVTLHDGDGGVLIYHRDPTGKTRFNRPPPPGVATNLFEVCIPSRLRVDEDGDNATSLVSTKSKAPLPGIKASHPAGDPRTW